MHRSTFVYAGILLFLLLGIGCQSRLKYSDKITLKAGEMSTREVSAPKKDQVVEIEATGTETFKIEVVLEKAVKPLAMRSSVKTYAASVNIPANQKFLIILTAADKDTTITLRANGVE